MPRPDAWGAALVTLGVAALTFALVKVNEWGWSSPGIGLAFAAAVIFLGSFIVNCLRAKNTLVEPGLFRIRTFVGASLAMAPFAVAFGAMLLSIVLWEQGTWGWSALKSGLAIAPGPLLVPTVSLLIAGRLIQRFGPAPVIALGLLSFAAGSVVGDGRQPRAELRDCDRRHGADRRGHRLCLPTMMGTATGALPASFATGSGVINMIRQTGMAVGVAAFVAIIGTPGSPERLVAFRHAWWAMAAVVALGLIPALLLRQAGAKAANASPLAANPQPS